MKKYFALLLVLLMLAVVFTGCKTTTTTAETTATAATAAATTAAATAAAETTVAETAAMAIWTITISGIGDKNISFTNADAAKMPTVEITATKKDVDQKWIGIPLKAILDFYGAADYSMVKAEASDGYSAELDKVTVGDAGTILGFSVDGQALSKDDGFVQIVVKSLPAKSWVKAVVKITIIK